MPEPRKPTTKRKGIDRAKDKEFEREHKLALVRLWIREEPEKFRKIFVEELGLKAA